MEFVRIMPKIERKMKLKSMQENKKLYSGINWNKLQSGKLVFVNIS